MHTNRLLMIGFAKDHELVTSSKSIKSITFHGVKNNNITKLVSGRKKRGGVQLRNTSDVVTVVNDQDKSFTLKSNLKGRVIEFNR